MAEQQHMEGKAGSGDGAGQLRRRGLIAGVVALVGGALARTTAKPARAADGDDLVIGENNQAQSTTQLVLTLGSPATTLLKVGTGGGASIGVLGHGGIGVKGEGGTAGVRGRGRHYWPRWGGQHRRARNCDI